MLTSLSVDEMLQATYMDWSTNLKRNGSFFVLFYLHLQRGHCLLLFALGYAAGILFGLLHMDIHVLLASVQCGYRMQPRRSIQNDGWQESHETLLSVQFDYENCYYLHFRDKSQF